MAGMYFTKEHEWVKVEGSVAVCGISDHAAHELGDVTFVELPAVGKQVKQGEVLAAIESVKAASDIYAPVSGMVVKINSQLEDAPEQVNESAEEAAWIAEIQITGAVAELAQLMSREQYDAYLKTL